MQAKTYALWANRLRSSYSYLTEEPIFLEDPSTLYLGMLSSLQKE